MQNAVNLFASRVFHPSYLRQTTDSIMGTETDISESRENRVTQWQPPALVKNSVPVVDVAVLNIA